MDWRRKLNEAKASAAALKASLHTSNGEFKEAPKSKCRQFFSKSHLQSEVVVKNNVYDKGILRNVLEILVPISERQPFFHRKAF